MKIAILGGCFTEQYNIPYNRLYHQTLKKFLCEKGKSVEIITRRYERISKCLGKITDLHKDFNFDLLIFHLRTEPIMRMSKLYYKYLNNTGKLKHSINLPYLNIFYPEKFDLLAQRQFNSEYHKSLKEGKIYHLLREINYFLGTLIGNKRYALKILIASILQIQEFCIHNRIEFLLLGPVSRPFSRFENKLSEDINKEFDFITKEKSIVYLNLIKRTTKDNKSMFFENGIHVSQAGHDDIASILYEQIINKN
jgi:hypothetical protein